MDNGILEVSMFQYLDGIIDDFPELITGKAATPEADHLFRVREADEAKYLPEERLLHSTTPLLSCYS